jgi:mannitol/fructose-specific phosphotransferase system IIA component (Ntr-type)
MKREDLAAYFDEDLIIWDLKGDTKDDVLLELAGRLETKRRVYKGNIIVDLLRRREELGTTAIGREYAVPHCRTIAVEKLTVVFAVKREGVDFDALDKKPTKLFFAIIAPPRDVNYLPLWGAIAELLKDAAKRKKLLGARGMKDLRDAILGSGAE